MTSSSNAIFIRQAESPGAPGVPAEEYPAFRERLIQSLLAFTDPKTGQPVIERILTPRGGFPWRLIGEAPDLTLVLRDLGLLSVLRADAPLNRDAPLTAPTIRTAFFSRVAREFVTGIEVPSFSIVDIAPTLLYSLGLPVPSDMEGTLAFRPSNRFCHLLTPFARRQTSLSTRTSRDEHGAVAPGGRGEAQVMERLKALGYL